MFDLSTNVANFFSTVEEEDDDDDALRLLSLNSYLRSIFDWSNSSIIGGLRSLLIVGGCLC